MLRGTNTTPGPETQDPIADGSAPRTYDPPEPTIIYLDPSNDQVWWTPDPNGEPDFDKFGGNVNGGRPDGPTGPLNGCLPQPQKSPVRDRKIPSPTNPEGNLTSPSAPWVVGWILKRINGNH